MRWVFAAALASGFSLLLALLLVGLNSRMRITASGLIGFGIAGLSAAYAGWPVAVAVVVAIAAAGFLGWYAASEEP